MAQNASVLNFMKFMIVAKTKVLKCFMIHWSMTVTEDWEALGCHWSPSGL